MGHPQESLHRAAELPPDAASAGTPDQPDQPDTASPAAPDFPPVQGDPQHHPLYPQRANVVRRTLAYVIDWALIIAAGMALAIPLRPALMGLGPFASSVGLLIYILYFMLTEGLFLNGRTPGKLALGIALRDPLTQRTPPALRVAVRALITGGPLFYEAAGELRFVLSPALAVVLANLALFLAWAIAWLMLFNNSTRQSLHDLLMRTVVVKAGMNNSTIAPAARPWIGHFAILAGFALFFGYAAVEDLNSTLSHTDPLRQLGQEIRAQADVRTVAMRTKTISIAARMERHVTADVWLRSLPEGADKSDAALRRRADAIAAQLRNHPEALGEFDVLRVLVRYGYAMMLTEEVSSAEAVIDLRLRTPDATGGTVQ